MKEGRVDDPRGRRMEHAGYESASVKSCDHQISQYARVSGLVRSKWKVKARGTAEYSVSTTEYGVPYGYGDVYVCCSGSRGKAAGLKARAIPTTVQRGGKRVSRLRFWPKKRGASR